MSTSTNTQVHRESYSLCIVVSDKGGRGQLSKIGSSDSCGPKGDERNHCAVHVGNLTLLFFQSSQRFLQDAPRWSCTTISSDPFEEMIGVGCLWRPRTDQRRFACHGRDWTGYGMTASTKFSQDPAPHPHPLTSVGYLSLTRPPHSPSLCTRRRRFAFSRRPKL